MVPVGGPTHPVAKPPPWRLGLLERVVQCRRTDPQEAPPGHVQHRWGGGALGRGRDEDGPGRGPPRTSHRLAPETLSSAWGPAAPRALRGAERGGFSSKGTGPRAGGVEPARAACWGRGGVRPPPGAHGSTEPTLQPRFLRSRVPWSP